MLYTLYSWSLCTLWSGAQPTGLKLVILLINGTKQVLAWIYAHLRLRDEDCSTCCCKTALSKNGFGDHGVQLKHLSESSERKPTRPTLESKDDLQGPRAARYHNSRPSDCSPSAQTNPRPVSISIQPERGLVQQNNFKFNMWDIFNPSPGLQYIYL